MTQVLLNFDSFAGFFLEHTHLIFLPACTAHYPA